VPKGQQQAAAEPTMSREEAPGTEGTTSFKVFIGGLNFNMNSEDLKRGGCGCGSCDLTDPGPLAH
jgi:hypothetical protein